MTNIDGYHTELSYASAVNRCVTYWPDSHNRMLANEKENAHVFLIYSAVPISINSIRPDVV